MQTQEDKEVMLLALACYCQQHRALLANLAPESSTANIMRQELDRASSLMRRVSASSPRRDCAGAHHAETDGPLVGHAPLRPDLDTWLTCV